MNAAKRWLWQTRKARLWNTDRDLGIFFARLLLFSLLILSSLTLHGFRDIRNALAAGISVGGETGAAHSRPRRALDAPACDRCAPRGRAQLLLRQSSGRGTPSAPRRRTPRALREEKHLITAATRGAGIGHGIIVRADCWGDRELLVHQLVHVAQCERSGGLEPFVRQYLRERFNSASFSIGPLEEEARRVAREICVMK